MHTIRRHRALLLVLLLALGLRLALWAQPLHEPANDEVEYITVAYDLLAGRGWAFYDHYHWLRAPLYPLFLAGSLWLFGGDLHSAALPNLALSVLNVALAYGLASRLVGPRPALLAAIMTAILWTNVTFASLSMAETLFTALFSVGLFLLLRQSTTRHPIANVIAAGVLFGLAALTRSAILPFLPLAASWLVVQSRRGQKSEDQPVESYQVAPVTMSKSIVDRPSSIVPLAFLLAAALTIAPWTIRNTIAYGRPILIETGLSYNLWAFNEPAEDLDTIQRTLERIPNPAERSDLATERGLERLREDPLILARKLWPNWVFLARVKPIQDRFLMESYYDSVDLPLFMAALVFDDLLYVLIGLGAIIGLLAAVRTRSFAVGEDNRDPRWLVLGYLIATIGVMLVTHGEARYRHFLFPVLIPYAAVVFVRNRRTAEPEGLRTKNPEPTVDDGRRSPAVATMGHQPPATSHQRRGIVPLILSAIFLWTVITSYPYQWAAENLARGWHTLAGDLLVRAGQPRTAADAYARAADAQDVPEPLLRRGAALLAAGDVEGALGAYRAAWRRNPIYEPAAARLGDLLRTRGQLDEARAAFDAPFLDQQRMVDWSWRELHPTSPEMIDIGGGLDYGFIGGMYQAEPLQGSDARWTEPQAWLRVSGPGILHLRLAAARPDTTSLPVQICAGSQCATFLVSPAWRTYSIAIAEQGTVLVEIRAPAYQAPDGRVLGVMIDSTAVERSKT